MQRNPHTAGPSPAAMHSKKHVTSSAQVLSDRHWLSCVQQLDATQSPHSVPSDGHVSPPPQRPFTQSASQHSAGSMHVSPSGLHCVAQVPLGSQVPLQQASDDEQLKPFGRQSTHTPASHSPLQHDSPAAQPPPFGVQGVSQTPPAHRPLQHSTSLMQVLPLSAQSPQVRPQIEVTSSTQLVSQLDVQQNVSIRQIAPAQSPQPGSSGGPSVQGGCEQSPPPQSPASHTFEQQSPAASHRSPSALHPPQTPALQRRSQQSASVLQKKPSGRHASPQRPSWHTPLQHCLASLQRAPFVMHGVSQMPSMQLSEQHCSAKLHPLPLAKQRAPHAPAVQTPAQQSSPVWQGAPSTKQPCPHVPPPRHTPLQHCSPSPHGVPSCEQLPPPQIPAAQIGVQQSAGLWQGSPPPRHMGGSGVASGTPASWSSGNPRSWSREPQLSSSTVRANERGAPTRKSTASSLPRPGSRPGHPCAG